MSSATVLGLGDVKSRIFYIPYNEITYGRSNTMNFDRLKKEWEENPMLVLTIGAIATTAVAKLIDSLSSASSRRAYSKQVDFRVKNQ